MKIELIWFIMVSCDSKYRAQKLNQALGSSIR